MNRHESDYDQPYGGYRTRRSEEYRNPELHPGHHSGPYDSAARGGYGNESNWDDYRNQGSQRNDSRNFSRVNITDDDTYSTSRNYGNMGSYGGAQGFGDVRGGLSSQRHYDSDTHYNFDSGMGSPREAREHHYSPAGHPAYQSSSGSGQRSQGWVSSGRSSGSDRDLYGTTVNREFQGERQGQYDFGREEFSSPSFGGDRGQYMGSGYDRYTRGDYGSSDGNYGSIGRMESGSGTPYGMSGYYSGGYGPHDYDERSGSDTRVFDRY